jgi:hypothetical protein
MSKLCKFIAANRTLNLELYIRPGDRDSQDPVQQFDFFGRAGKDAENTKTFDVRASCG